MNLLDTLLPIVGLLANLAIPTVAITASYRRAIRNAADSSGDHDEAE
ncbi:hypothetical protein ACQP2T_27970 [Nonomuraea sp. CA-143628]